MSDPKDNFEKCEKCQNKSGDPGEEFCSACEQNFNYIWKLENQNQILRNAFDAMRRALKGVKYILEI